jgi:xanthine phosphoribosyltransferase
MEPCKKSEPVNMTEPRKPSVPKRQFLVWQDIELACSKLVNQLKEAGILRRSTSILAISRGGLVPASILAYSLNVPIAGSVRPDSVPLVRSNRTDLIVVDDICDTGVTFRRVRKWFPNALFIAPYLKPQGRSECALWSVELPKDVWAVFPWAPSDLPSRISNQSHEEKR